ncbi:PREDICTED: pentatricopeptide repeat-containing protein At4g38150-like [Fragaria vesca subsp. vesca]|uniref:pentatricopeptide repeat-containing protein At4g38150-like n=1 Tax=Fragaria vesca subsp. vesca TaxID=101020 RepID=UPI0002C3020D|nr:PREDICTED: pentatricopeptide repeat-containing protein At4g38150-like [Fragaria vesca subsp. vesca]
MAARLVSRSALRNQSNAPFSLLFTKLHLTTVPPINPTHKPIISSSSPTTTRLLLLPPPSFSSFRLFSSSSPATKGTTLVNFSLPSDDEDDTPHPSKPNDRSSTSSSRSLPPPYDPFNKKPAFEDPEDPKDLQEVFHKMRSDGLQSNAVKMFDALSKDGLTHEALELFAHIKDKGQMPDVVAHTAVIEAYATAGKPKDVLKVYMRMLACGVAPNAYTYSVLIKALAAEERFVGDAKKYVVEMLGKGIRPNAGTYVAVFEALAGEEKAEEARVLWEEMRGKGFVADEQAVREVLKGRRGAVVRSVINILFGK